VVTEDQQTHPPSLWY